jgi:tetratricopeptide (TPR) repeat protein
LEAYSSKIDGYLNELKDHTRAAISAFSVLESSESRRSLRFCVQKFLSECEEISKILWNTNNKKLRKHIRSVLSISGDSPFSSAAFSRQRTVLRGIEKAGGSEKKLKNNKMENKSEENIVPEELAALSYNQGIKTLTFEGKNYEILPLLLAARDLYASLPLFKEFQECAERLEMNPEDATALFQKAVLLYKARRFEAALQLIAQVLKIVPDDYRVWYNKGVILEEMCLHEEALTAYNRAIELEPSFEIAWDNKGVILAKLGRFEEALGNYEKVLLIHPQFAEAWAGKGSILLTLDRKEEALEAYRLALTIRPDYKEALTCISSLLSRLRRFEEALDTYDKVIQLAPTEPELWAGRSLVLLELDRHEEALQSCNKSLELKPGFIPALEIKVKILSEISRQSLPPE